MHSKQFGIASLHFKHVEFPALKMYPFLQDEQLVLEVQVKQLEISTPQDEHLFASFK